MRLYFEQPEKTKIPVKRPRESENNDEKIKMIDSMTVLTHIGYTYMRCIQSYLFT